MDINQLIATLVGGIMSLIGSLICISISNRHASTTWSKDKKLSVYKLLIQELQSLEINAIYSENALTTQELLLDPQALNLKLENLSNLIKNNLADIYIFAPEGIYKELLKLEKELYEIISNEDNLNFKISTLKESKIFSTVMHAKKICQRLKTDLLKNK